MSTANSLLKLLHQHASLVCDGLTVRVLIIDAKETFGHTLCEITPLEGSGTRWVRRDSLSDLQQPMEKKRAH